MRDQFISGIRDDATRVELFKHTTVTFDSAFTEATAKEREVQNAAGAFKTLTDKTYKQENFFHEHRSKFNKDNRPPLKHENKPKRFHRPRNQVMQVPAADMQILQHQGAS